MDSNINNQELTYEPIPPRVLPFQKLQEGREAPLVRTTSDEIIKDTHGIVQELYNQLCGIKCPYCGEIKSTKIIESKTGREYDKRPVTLLECQLCHCRVWAIMNLQGTFRQVPFDYFEQMKLDEKGEKREKREIDYSPVVIPKENVLLAQEKEKLEKLNQAQQAVEEYNKIVGKRGRPVKDAKKKGGKK